MNALGKRPIAVGGAHDGLPLSSENPNFTFQDLAERQGHGIAGARIAETGFKPVIHVRDVLGTYSAVGWWLGFWCSIRSKFCLCCHYVSAVRKSTVVAYQRRLVIRDSELTEKIGSESIIK